MNKELQLESVHLNRKRLLRVDYKQNPGPAESGFDVLDVPFERNLCRMYPSVHAAVMNYEGIGYRMYMGFIQFITRRERMAGGITKESLSIDSPDFGNPFFSYGYPPSLYDAPCYNLGNCEKLIWIADTFLVTMPSRMNAYSVSCLAGFRWGYKEWDENNNRRADILAINEIENSSWNNYLPLLRTKFPELKYEKYE